MEDNRFSKYCEYLNSIGVNNNNFLFKKKLYKPYVKMNEMELLKEISNNIIFFFRDVYRIDNGVPYMITDGSAKMLFNLDLYNDIKNMKPLQPYALFHKPLVWLGLRECGKTEFIKGLITYTQFKLLYNVIYNKDRENTCANHVILISKNINYFYDIDKKIVGRICEICNRFSLSPELREPKYGIIISKFTNVNDALRHIDNKGSGGSVYNIFVDEFEFLDSSSSLLEMFRTLKDIKTDLNVMFFSTFNDERSEIDHTRFMQNLFLFRKGNYDLTDFSFNNYFEGTLITEDIVDNHFVPLKENISWRFKFLPDDRMIRSEYFLRN